MSSSSFGMPMSLFVLKVHEISSQGDHFSFEIPPDWVNDSLGESGYFASEKLGKLDFSAQHVDNDIWLDGKIFLVLKTSCVRCLSDFEFTVQNPIRLLLSEKGAASKREDVEVLHDEPDFDFFVGDKIALDSWIRETILVECPMNPICSESCKGISVDEHGNTLDSLGKKQQEKPVDPRLAPLLDVASQLQKAPKSGNS